jgi:uncharacterized protein YggU (UPF0235/DUF167 family)
MKKGYIMALHPLIIFVEVTPEHGYKGWHLLPGNKLKTYHKEPESRDANEYLMKTLAETLGISHSHITLIKGVETRFKEIKIGKDVTFEALCEALQVKRA